MNKSQEPQNPPYPSQWYAQIDDYLAGKLSERDQDAFEEAFFNDEQLFAEVQLRRDIRQQLKAGPPTTDWEDSAPADNTFRMPAPSPRHNRLRETKGSNWRYWGYAMAGAAALAFLVIFKQQLEIPLPGATATVDIQSASLSDLYGPRYAPSPTLEPRASAALRSDLAVAVLPPRPLGDPNATELIPPTFTRIADRENLPIMHPGLIFEWRHLQEDPRPLTVVILNNQSQVVGRQENAADRFTYIASLPAGLYYWSLESPENTVFVGKFVVPPTVDISEER